MTYPAAGRSASHVERESQSGSERHGVQTWNRTDSDAENDESRMARTDSRQSMLDPQRVRIWDQHHRGLVATVRRLLLDGVKHSGNRLH